jgi:glycogen(starch) synthase
VSALRKVIVVCHQYPPWQAGGLAEYAERWLRHTRRHRPELELTLYTMNQPYGQPPVSRQAGSMVIRPRTSRWLARKVEAAGHFSPRGRLYFGLSLLLFNVAVVLGLCRRRRAGTVVAVHDWQSTPAGILAALLLRLPVVYHVHNTEATMVAHSDITDPAGLIRTCQRLMSRLASHIVVPTPEMRALLASDGWPPHRIRVVAHGYEDTRSTKEPVDARTEHRAALASGDGPVLVFAGRLSQVKGIHLLLRALPEIVARHPSVRLYVLGVGSPGTDEDAAVDRLVDQLGIAEHTHVYHRYLPRAEVRRHYLAADVCVFPSTYEPFGLVSVEAMALGVPVVLGPGFSETIAYDGKHSAALRMTGERPSELAELIDSLLADPARAGELAARGRKHVRQTFRWSTAITETIGVYQRAVGRAGAG